MTIDRTTIVRGPCKITYDGETFYSKGSVTVTLDDARTDIMADAFGRTGQTRNDLKISVAFEPVGEIESLTKLYRLGSTAMGASLYGSTDKALVIVSAASTYTIHNAQITGLPSLRLSATQTAFGTVTFTGLIANSGDPAELTSYLTISAGAAATGGFDPAKIVMAPYQCVIEGVDPFVSEAGFEFTFDLQTTPVYVDGIGTVDMTVASIGASMSCIPVGVSVAVLNSFFGGRVGEPVVAGELEIRPPASYGIGGLIVSFANHVLTAKQERFSTTENRIGSITAEAIRTFTSGVPNALYTIAVVSA